MRVFAALRPPPEVLGSLEAALEDVRASSGLSLRWTDPAQWHLTLAFRADLPEGSVEETLGRLAELAAAHAPLRLELAGAGVFAHRTLWAGVGGQTQALAALMAEPLLGEDAVEARTRRRAHLTLARVSARAPRPPRRRRRGQEPPPDPTRLVLEAAVHTLSVYRNPVWVAREVELVASQLGQGRSGGPLHEVLGVVPLGG